MNNLPATLLLGLFFGLKHAIEADHIAAVSTIASNQKSIKKAALIGSIWGAGHTTTLFLVGTIVLLTKTTIPENVSLMFEILVGFMLVILGVSAIRNKKTAHTHVHTHGEKEHTHIHAHFPTKNHQHKKSFAVGALHGLAGSGALMILILSTIDSTIQGMLYIIVFGIGSIIGMAGSSSIISLPYLVTSKKIKNIDRKLQIVAGCISIVIGTFIIYTLGIKELLHI